MRNPHWTLLLLAGIVPAAQAEPRAEEVFFRQVRPLLETKCLGCHGAEKKLQGGLDVRTRAALLRGGDSGPALVPGAAARSLLYRAVLRDGDLKMPPKETAKLTAEETAALKAWIDGGAPWPAGQTTERPADAAGDRWAFAPVRRPAVPAGSAAHPIDAFLNQRLRERGLPPAPAAERRTLVRRLTFDLTGLPPTIEDIERAAADPSPAWFEKLCDRLLASPHYGERMSQHWLDVVRYADTSGFANDYERPHAWRYRDYVVRSFNADTPYDRFVLEQLAGDELAPDSPEAAIAVGFLRMGPWEHTGMSVAAVTRQMWLDDVTHSVGVAFLGQGLGCARCHDHKFDPIPTKDYYRIQAVFASTQFAERATPFLPTESTFDFTALRTVVERQLRDRPLRPDAASPDKATLGMIANKRNEYLKRALQRFEPLAFSVQNQGTPATAILQGGALDRPGETVAPGVLGAAGPGADVPATAAGRRLALARWIASKDNPLTARVLVNRVWQMHFGTGLVATPNNFGKMGGRPSHPELLDWLAAWFVDHGWSLKKLHALIVSSAAYQRSGRHPDPQRGRQLDPDNRLLAVYPPRRLSAEELRDALLAASGELSRAAGGPGVFPELSPDVALQPRQIMGAIAPAYQPSPRPEQRNRRTLYVFRMRGLHQPLLEVFNQPGSDNSCERRDETLVTPQVFALFNGQFTHDRALALAHQLTQVAERVEERIALAFRAAFQRPPTEAELRLAAAHVARLTEHHRAHAPVVVQRPSSVKRQMVAEQNGALFTWEELLDTEHLTPDLKPWDVGPETRALAELCLVLFNANEFLYLD